jgi:hypothetical protein
VTSISYTDDPTVVHLVYTAADLAATVSTVTVYRVYEGSVATPVRSGVSLFAAGGFVVDDHEVPVGVEVSYTVRQFSSTGAELGYTPSVSITIPVDGPEVAYLSDPLDATRSVRVILSTTAASSPSAPIPGTLHRVGMRTVALVGQRGLLESLNMDFYTTTIEDRDTVLGLIGATGGLLLIRTAPPVPVPRLLYVWAANAVPTGFDLRYGDEGTSWANTVQEVSPTMGPLSAYTITWQTYIDAFPTWADFNAAYSSWFAAIQNPPEV